MPQVFQEAITTRRFDSAADRLDSKLGTLANFDAEALRVFAQDAAQKVTPMVRSMLVNNYQSSGAKVRTGKLLQEIGRSEVHIVSDKGFFFIKIQMPSGVEPYKFQSNFYEVANAVNSGSVRLLDFKEGRKEGLKGFGEARKRTIKKFALKTGKVSERQRQSLVEAGVLAGTSVKRGEKGGASLRTSRGRAVVTKGFQYYFLSRPQKQQIESGFWEEFQIRLRQVGIL